MLHPTRLGLAGGILWAVSMVVLTFVWMNWDYGMTLYELLRGIYPGYQASVPGALIGAVWGFLDAFLGLFILAWIYNALGGSE